MTTPLINDTDEEKPTQEVLNSRKYTKLYSAVNNLRGRVKTHLQTHQPVNSDTLQDFVDILEKALEECNE